jgi:hypothetical protein
LKKGVQLATEINWPRNVQNGPARGMVDILAKCIQGHISAVVTRGIQDIPVGRIQDHLPVVVEVMEIPGKARGGL